MAFLISLVTQIDQVFAKDTDGDGIVDALDAQPDIASAIVLNLNESSDLNANGDALKKEGNYQDTFPNLVLPYTKKETTADYSSGNQSLYGNLELFNDGKFKYNSKSNTVNGVELTATHDDLPAGALREEIFSFTSDNGFEFQILVSIIGTNDSAVISKLDYVIEAATSAQIEKANGFLRVKDKDTNEAKFTSQQTVGDYGTFTLTADGAWNYSSTQSNHHLMSLGSSVKDNFTVSALDGTTRDISISITGSKNPSPTTTDDGYGNDISYYEVPSEGQLTLREEITIDGPYFTPFNGWTQNGATHQQIFRLEKGKRYSFKMEGITLADPELHILGPLDIANKRYSVLQQPNLGTVTINKHTGSWVYSANDDKPSQNDNSTIQFTVDSDTPVLVPADTLLSGSNAKRTKEGTENTAAEYLIKINGHSITFKSSDDGKATGNGLSNSELDTDMSFEIVEDVDPGGTPYAKYDVSYPRLYIHVESDGTSTTAQVATAINNATNMDGEAISEDSNGETIDVFFDANAKKVLEIDGVNLTSNRLNKTKAGGIFYQWSAGNDNGDFMGDDAELFITPKSTGYYLLGCMGKNAGRGYGADFLYGTFNIIAKEVAADTFTTDAGALLDIEASGDLVKPASWGNDDIKDSEVDGSTPDHEIISDTYQFKNFTGKLDFDGDVDYVKINLDIERWYSFEVGGEMIDPNIELVTDSNDWASGGEEDGGKGLNGIVKFKPSQAGTYYLKISSGSPTYRGEGDSIGTGQYTVVVSGGPSPSWQWLTEKGVPTAFSSIPDQDVPSGLDTTVKKNITDKFSGKIEIDGDRDWYKYSLEKGKIYRWVLSKIDIPKPSMKLRDENGDIIQQGIIDNFTDSRYKDETSVVFIAPYTGDYFIEVFSNENIDENQAGAATGSFNLNSKELIDDYGGDIIYADDDGYAGRTAFDGKSPWIPASYDFTDAGYLQAGRKVSGTFYAGKGKRMEDLEQRDFDFFGIDMLSQNNYSFNIAATSEHSLGDSYARIVLFDSDGVLVEGDVGNGSLSLENITPVTDGYYYLRAQSAHDFNNLMGYTISTTFFSDDYPDNRNTTGLLNLNSTSSGKLDANGDTDWIRVDVEAGKRYKFTIDLNDENNSNYSAPIGAWLKLNGPQVPSNYWLQRALSSLDSAETPYTREIGNDEKGSYKLPFFNGDSVTNVGATITFEDTDWIAADLKEGRVYQINVIGRASNITQALPDPKFSVHGPDGKLLKESNSNAGVSSSHQGTDGKDAEMLFTATETGTYYFEVAAETNTPLTSIIADGAASNGATTITVDPIKDYLVSGTVINFTNGATFTLSQQAQVTNTTLTGTLKGNITDNEEAYYSQFIVTSNALDGDTSININPLPVKVTEGSTIIFSNGSTFSVSKKAEKNASTLTGKLSGDLSASEAGFLYIVGRYKLGMVELPTGVVSQHYHDISEAEEEVTIDWTPRYTAPYFIEIGTHWGAKGDYRISLSELDDLSGNDTIGDTKETAIAYNFGDKITSVIDYGGDRDWYAVEMIPGESYQIELDGSADLSYSRQSPLMRVYDEYGKPKGALWEWVYNRKWGKPGGAYDEDSKSSTYVYSVPQNRFENDNQPKKFYLESSANIAGNVTFKVTHLLDDQKENMSTTGIIEVGGTASGTWEKNVEDGANEDLLWGTHGGDGDWFKANLIAGNTYKIDLMAHHFNRPSIKVYTEAGVYFRDNQKHPNGDHDASVWIDTIKDGHAQMTFTANRTGAFFINAWNTKSWGIEEGGSGNTIYDLSLVHIPDDVKGSMDTSHTLLTITSNGAATDGATSINIDALVFQTRDSSGETNSNAMLEIGSVINFDKGATFTLSEKALNGHTTLIGKLNGNITDDENGFSENKATLNRKNDRDWFKVKLNKGSVYEFNLVGNSLKDPELRIRDSHGKQLFYNDHINGWWNPKITYTANNTGIYYIDVAGIDAGSYNVNWIRTWAPTAPLDSNDPAKFVGSEIEVPSSQVSEFLGNASEHTIGNFIQDEIVLENNRKWYKMDLKQTRSYRFEQYGDSMQAPSMFIRDKNGVPVFPKPKKDKARSTGEKLVLNYDAPSTGVYYLDAGGFWSSGYQKNGRVAGVPTGTYTIKSYDLGEATERALSWDTNEDGSLNDDDTFDKATPSNLVVGAQDTSGQIENATIRDLYSISLKEGATYRFRISGALINGDIDRGVKTKLFLHDSDGELLHTKTGADLDYKATKTDTFYIAVGATTGQSTGTKFRPNGVPYGYDIKLIQKRAPKTLPSASWLSSLNVISSDISDAVISGSSDGKLDRSELISILDKVKVNGITEGELTDLRILVANYKELGLTNYLVTILDNLANGDPANQYYTGRKDSNLGNTSRENIGNLYPGSSEGRVQRLINKWFKGIDSPATPKLYVYLDLPLFFNKARATDVNQGSLGDCYLLSSLSAVAESTIASIDGRYPSVYPGDMFVDNGDNTYGVRMYDNHGAERWVTVDKFVPGYRADELVNVNTDSGETWTMMAEKAYVQLNESDNIGQDGTNRYGIGNHFGIAGGSAVMALSHITGQESSYKYISEDTDDNDPDSGKAWLIAQIEAKLPLVFSTSAPCALATTKGVKRKHTYTYESYGVVEGNEETIAGQFFLRNPWGNTHANVTWEDLKELGSNVAYLDGTRTKMSRIDPTDSAFSASDAASAPGDENDDSGLTAIETNGNINLYYDEQQRLYAGTSGDSITRITLNGKSIKRSVSGRTALAAEKVDGSNQMLWKDNSSGAFQRMSFNVEWQFVVTGDEHEQGTAGYETSERSFYGNIVTFDLGNYGTLTSGSLAQRIDDGSDATAPQFSVEDYYVFIGWDKEFTNINNDLTVTAQYEADYDNDGIGNSSDADMDGDGIANDNDPDRDGDNITDTWESDNFGNLISANATSDADSDGDTDLVEFNKGTNPKVADYDVTFNLGDYGTLTSGSLSQRINAGAGATAPEFVTDDYWVFTGWDKTFSEISGDLSITAQYEADDDNDNIANSTDTDRDGDNITDTWEVENFGDLSSADANSDTDSDGDSDLVEFNNSTNPKVADYDVTFSLGDYGTLTSGSLSQRINAGAGATAPEFDTEDYWAFTGWDKTFSEISGDLSITAQYEADDDNDNIANSTDTDRDGDNITDTWEIENFGDLSSADANSDTDSDGDSDLVEFNNSTNPKVADYDVIFILGDYGTLTSGSLSQRINAGAGAIAPEFDTEDYWVFTGWDKTFSEISGDLSITAQYEADDDNDNIANSTDTDRDGDGLFNDAEIASGTDPDDSDSDDDGLLDGVETGGGIFSDSTDTGTNPLVADTDGDGLLDGAEVTAGTNPTLEDTDNDGLIDKVETGSGTFVDKSDTGTNPLVADSDGDGLLDGVEAELVNKINSDPKGDNVPDAISIGSFEPGLISFDTLGSNTSDTEIGLYDSEGVLLITNDDTPELSFQSMVQLELVKGTYYIAIHQYNTEFGGNNFEVTSTVEATESFKVNVRSGSFDIDNDIMAESTSESANNPLWFSVQIGSAPSIYDPNIDNSDSDSDNDGSILSEEIAAGTDPLDEDSDDDGILDGAEATAGTNPSQMIAIATDYLTE